MRDSERVQTPYRGIQPFRYVDRDRFFGRQQEITDLLAKVLVARLVVLFGESGTGKSSLINAGLIPGLIKEGLQPERIRVRPLLDEPFVIERIPAESDANGPFLPSIFAGEQTDEAGDQARHLFYSPQDFLAAIRTTAVHPVLLFDQFEELFTLFAQDHTRTADEIALRRVVLDVIFELVNDRNLRVKVILILREDFLGKLEVMARQYPQILDYRVRLRELDQDGAREAILGPFENENPYCSRLTSALATTILRDLSGSQPDVRIQPTQLQIICSRLCEAYASTLPEITVNEYRAMGDINGILEGFLEAELAQLAPTLKAPAILIMGNLITEAGTRDVVSLDKLTELTAEDTIDKATLITTVDLLEKRRLLNKSYQRETAYYEIASEYLVPPVRREKQELDTRKAAAQAAEEAAERERVVARQRALVQAQERAQEQAKAAHRFRRLTAILAVVVVITGATAGYAYYQRNAAVDAQRKTYDTVTALLLQQAEIYALVTSDFDKALGILNEVSNRDFAPVDKVVELKQTIAQKLVERGRTYAQQGDYPLALKDLEQAKQFDPSLLLVPAAEVALAQARSYARQSKANEALTEWRRAVDLDPTLRTNEPELAKALIEQARRAYSNQADYMQVLGPLRQATEFNPTQTAEIASICVSFGQEYANQGQVEPALAALRQALALDTGIGLNPEVEVAKKLVERGHALADQGQSDAALSAFQAAIHLDPTLKLVPEAEVALAQGRAYARQGDSEQALALLRKANELDPSLTLAPEVEVLVVQGREYARLGQIDKAVAALQDAIELDPNLALVEPEVAKALKAAAYTAFSQKEEFSKVLQNLRLAARFDPTTRAEVVSVSISFGQEYARQGEREAALAAFRLAAELDPNQGLVPEAEVERTLREKK